MSENNRIGIDIQSTYDGKGVDAARRDLNTLNQETVTTHKAEGASLRETIEARRKSKESQADLRVETEKATEAAREHVEHMGGLRAAVAGVGLAAIATTAGIVGMVAALAALAREQEKIDRLVNRTSAQLGFTSREAGLGRGDVADLIRDLSRQPGMDLDSAAGVLTAAGGPGIDEAAYRRAIALANDFALATGTTAPKAAKMLADALRDPEEGLRKLDQQYNFLSAEQATAAERFRENGEHAKALEIELGALERRVSGLAVNSMTPLASATNDLGNAWDSLKTKIGDGAGISVATQALANMVRSLAWMVENGDKLSYIAVPWWVQAFFPDRDKIDPEEAKKRAAAAAARAKADRDLKNQPALMGPSDELVYRTIEERNRRARQLGEQAQRQAKQEAGRLSREATAGYLAGVKFDQDTQQEIDRAVADMDKRLKAREYYENIYGTDITNNKTTADLAAYHQQQLAAIDAGTQQEDNLMRLNAGFDEHGRYLGKTVDKYNDLKFAIEGWGRDTSRALAKLAVDGKISFDSLSDAARNFAEELIAIQIQRSIMDPLLKGATSWLGGLFGGAAGGGGGGGGVDINAAIGHTGYGPGDMAPTRYVHPAYFDRAPRAHSGIGPNERPMVITKDESVLTPGQMRALGNRSPSVTVNVINQSGSPVEAQASAPRFDGESMVVDLVLRRLGRDSGARDSMRRLLEPPA